MKWLFGVLLLASLAFFAFMQWGLSGFGDNKTLQPQPPLLAEKIKLLPAVISPVSSVQPAVQSSAQPAAQTTGACMEWGDFSGNDLVRATAALSALKLGNTLSQRQIEHTIGYWVYLPALDNSAEVAKKVAQIKALGLGEYFIIQEEGKWKNTISLGVFKTADAAHKFRDSVKAKGLESAIVGERTSKSTFTVFVLKDPGAEAMAKIAIMQKDFPDSELKATSCRPIGPSQLTSGT